MAPLISRNPLIVSRITHSLTTHRVLSPVLVELLLRLAGEAALGAGVGPFAAVVHLGDHPHMTSAQGGGT